MRKLRERRPQNPFALFRIFLCLARLTVPVLALGIGYPLLVGQERLYALCVRLGNDQVGTSLADVLARLLEVQVTLARTHRLDLTSPSDFHTGFGALMGLQFRHLTSPLRPRDSPGRPA